MEHGEQAPDFHLLDQNNVQHQLTDYKGRKVLLYFYPKDMTPGCTTQAKEVRDHWQELKDLELVVLGVSTDSVESHKTFAEKHELPFPLLADTDKEVVNRYGVWKEKQMFGNTYMGIQRDAFLIDEQRNIMRHFEKVQPKKFVHLVKQELDR